MRKIIAFLAVFIVMLSIANIGECSKSDDMIDIITMQVDDIDAFETLYYMWYSDEKKVFKSEDGMSLGNVFDMNLYQIPDQGTVYIWKFGDEQSIVFLYNSHDEMIGFFNLKEHMDLVMASLPVTECYLKSLECDMESLRTVSMFFATMTNKTHAAYEMILYAQENSKVRTGTAQKNVWYKTE